MEVQRSIIVKRKKAIKKKSTWWYHRKGEREIKVKVNEGGEVGEAFPEQFSPQTDRLLLDDKMGKQKGNDSNQRAEGRKRRLTRDYYQEEAPRIDCPNGTVPKVREEREVGGGQEKMKTKSVIG